MLTAHDDPGRTRLFYDICVRQQKDFTLKKMINLYIETRRAFDYNIFRALQMLLIDPLFMIYYTAVVN